MFKVLVVLAVLAYVNAMPYDMHMKNGTHFNKGPSGMNMTNGTHFNKGPSGMNMTHGSHFNFNITEEDKDRMDMVLGQIITELWDNKRIFEVARAFANDENLRNETLEKFKEVFGPNPKDAIYNILVDFRDELNATRGMGNVFNATDAEMESFDELWGSIEYELLENKKIFHLIQVIVQDETQRNKIVGGLMEILYGVDPKSAIWNFFVAFKAELEMVDSHDFSLDANETAQFDALFNQITYELFAKRRIYEVLRDIIIDEDLQEFLSSSFVEIFAGDQPKQSLFKFMTATVGFLKN